MDVELVVHIVRVLLGEDDARAAEWRLAHQVITGVATEAEIVRVSSALPDDVTDFTGRAAELDLILAAAEVVVIEGMAGVGKTQLAARAAHLLLRQGKYSDVQLSVNLRGYDRERPPADPAAVLDGFLRQLGVSGDRIHALDLAGRSTAFRKLLIGRKALVLLDNAVSEDQVRPLLPDSPDALVLVTSRRALPGLPGERLSLTAFGQEEVLDLLRRRAGVDRIAADVETATRIGELVGRLPLALGLVAGLIADRPHWTLADHLLRLSERHEHRHLDSGVELALDLSYRALPAGHQRTFRLTALHPGPDFDAAAAAALAGVDTGLAQRHLDDLLTDHLLQLKTPSRYELHDLVRVFAAARVVDEEPKSAQREALTRLFDHYLRTAAAARNTLNPAERHECVPAASVADARAWLEAEHTNLVAVADHTARHGWYSHTERLMTTLAKHLDMTGRHHDAITLYHHVLNTADRQGQGVALHNLGRVHWRLGDHEASLHHFARALEIHRDTGNRAGEAAAINNMGNVHQRLGHYDLALQLYLSALVLRRELGDRVGEGATLGNVGIIYHRLGHYDEAFHHYRPALEIRREVGDREGEGMVLANIAETHQCLQQWQDARTHYEQALAIFDELDDRSNRSYGLAYLAQVLQKLGFTKLAVEHHAEALELAREVGELSVETEALNRYGETLTALGRPASARPYHERALDLAAQTGIRYERARALDGLAAALSRTGRHKEALRHRTEALALFAELNVPGAPARQEPGAGPGTAPAQAAGHEPAVSRESANPPCAGPAAARARQAAR